MITVKAIFDDGDELTTRFNGTQEEAKIYYLGKTFNLGADTDRLVECVKVEVISVEPAPITEARTVCYPRTNYSFRLTAVRTSPSKTDPNTTSIWSRWDSADSRFVVCCEDDAGRHIVSIFLQGDDSPYRPEVYTRNDNNTGNTAGIVVRPGHDRNGLIGLDQIDAYMHELAETRKAVEAIQFIFFDNWAATKANAKLDHAIDNPKGD